MEGLTTGRIVHVGKTNRAAIITQVWNDDGVVNLYLFPDGVNEPGHVECSVTYGDQEGQWHWPARA